MLEDLFGGPRLVSKTYNCSHNMLNSLEGSPLKLRDFNCSHNFLEDLDRGPVVSGSFIKNGNVFK